MRALVISDIHANLQALEAVLAAAPPYDKVWNLGDIVGYGANPDEVCTIARQLGGVTVRGNHDRACSGTMYFGDYRELSRLAATSSGWTRSVLTNESLAWLSRLRRGPIRPIPKVACVHGSPRMKMNTRLPKPTRWPFWVRAELELSSADIRTGRLDGNGTERS